MFVWFMRSPAWQSLDAIARAVYVEMASRYGGPGSNNGRIPYSVREAAKALRIGKTTASRAMHALEARGFIVAMQKGTFNLKARHATEWRLTEFPCDVTDKLSTKEFMRWTPKTLESGTSNGTNRYPQRDRSVPIAEPTSSKTTRTVPVKEP